MPTPVIMPQLGESVIEGTVTKWLKSPGEAVKEYEPLLEVNTDKVDTEIPSSANGVLMEILIPEGTTVRAGTVLALIGETGEIFQEERPGRKAESQPGKPAAEAGFGEGAVQSQRENGSRQQASQESNLGFISPVVSKIAQEYQLDLHQVKGTGLGGRITKKDVLAYIDLLQTEGLEAESAQPEKAPGPRAPAAPMPGSQTPAFRGEQEILPLTPVRRAIAEHMVSSMRSSPHVTTVMEADLSRLVAHRVANQAAFSRDGANLTYTAYFVSAAVAALKAYPLVNSSWSDGGILLHRQINVGIATAMGEGGLIVPVLKNADSLSLLGLARAVNDLANRARAHKLLPEEVKDGTFTITNHGTSGSLFATPIINQPQCAILGVGLIQKRVVVIEQAGIGDTGVFDAIAIRPMVYVSLTFDHRILDGAAGDAFLGKVVETLERWA